MSAGPQATLLPDGRRLHLHHGPIDLILDAWGSDREACFASAVARFDTVLSGLALELVDLREPLQPSTDFRDPIARQMANAVRPYRGVFVTPMAAVAGAVADTVLAAMIAGQTVDKAYVNNGGDIAFFLGPGQSLTGLGIAGQQRVTDTDKARGIASSGWGGRSHSLGIADTVTVSARTAAMADVAATLIANAVDLPGHPAIERQPASSLFPDSDLGARLVTTDVGCLSVQEIAQALDTGVQRAKSYCDRGLIQSATLILQGHTRVVAEATLKANPELEPLHA